MRSLAQKRAFVLSLVLAVSVLTSIGTAVGALASHRDYMAEYDALKLLGQHEEKQRAFLGEAEAYIASNPDGPEIAQAKLNKAIAISWYGTRRDRGHGELRDQEADSILEEILSKHADSPVAPAAMYYRACLYDVGFERRRHHKVSDLLLAVAERYPHSSEAPRALLDAARQCPPDEMAGLQDRVRRLALGMMEQRPTCRVDAEVFDHLFGTDSHDAVETGLSLCRTLIDRGAETAYWRLAWDKRLELNGVLGEPKCFKETAALVRGIADPSTRDEIAGELAGVLAFHIMRRPEDRAHADALVAELLGENASLTRVAAAAYYFLAGESEKYGRQNEQLAEDEKRLCGERVYRLTVRRQVELDRTRPRAERTDWETLSTGLAKGLADYRPDAQLLCWVYAFYVENQNWNFWPEALQVMDDIVGLDPSSANVAQLRYQRALAIVTLDYEQTGKYRKETRDELLSIAEDYPGTEAAVSALFELVYHHAIQNETEAAQAANLELLAQGTPYARERYKRNIDIVLQREYQYFEFYRDAYHDRLAEVLPQCRFLNNAQKSGLVRTSHLQHVVDEPHQLLQEIRRRFLEAGEEVLANEALLLEGQLLLMKWQYPEAARVFEQAKQLPGATARQVRDADRFLAATCYYLKDYGTAGTLLSGLVGEEADPERPEYMLHLAMMKYDQGMLRDARTLLRSLVREYPECAAAKEAKRIIDYMKPLLKETD